MGLNKVNFDGLDSDLWSLFKFTYALHRADTWEFNHIIDGIVKKNKKEDWAMGSGKWPGKWKNVVLNNSQM